MAWSGLGSLFGIVLLFVVGDLISDNKALHTYSTLFFTIYDTIIGMLAGSLFIWTERERKDHFFTNVHTGNQV